MVEFVFFVFVFDCFGLFDKFIIGLVDDVVFTVAGGQVVF